MEYLFISFIAGVLTVLAPCVFTLLPVILGGSLTGTNWKKPATIIVSLSISIFLFTLILKASTLLINIPPDFWKYLSGALLISFGILTIFPDLWSKINVKLKLSSTSDKLLEKGAKKRSFIGDILIGSALGPVFSSCSPTYAIIIATILPQEPLIGVLNLIVYILGLALVLSNISIFGQSIIKRAKWAVDPNGKFKKFLGILFLVIGLSILTGSDKSFETFLLDRGLFDVTQIEQQLLEQDAFNKGDTYTKSKDIKLSVLNPQPAPEIKGIENWINSEPLTLDGLKGSVVLVDFWTYSCINCIRTLPYLISWYEKYKDDGLVIIGMHSPEFAFEKLKPNVENAIEKYSIKYPVALDNNFTTWNAFKNMYWPASYFIDRNGDIVHTHFGEGNYDESERIIQYLLGLNNDGIESINEPNFNRSQTPETYLGYSRFDNFLNIPEFKADEVINYSYKEVQNNAWALKGDWIVSSEYIMSKGDNSKLTLTFNAKEVFLVMGSKDLVDVEVKVFNGDQNISSEMIAISTYDIYKVVELTEFSSSYRLEISAKEGVQMNAFTFGGQ